MEDFIFSILENHWGISGHVVKLVGDVDFNFKIASQQGDFILKLQHPNTKFEDIAFQNDLLIFLNSQSFSFQIPAVVPTIQSEFLITEEWNHIKYHCRLLTWIEGDLWGEVRPHTDDLSRELGLALGQLTVTLDAFSSAKIAMDYSWNSANFLKVVQGASRFQNEQKNELIRHFEDHFKSQIAPAQSQLPHGIIHGDANDYNLVVRLENGYPKFHGVIDFGDLNYSPKINELAIAIAYAAMHVPNPLERACEVVKGFNVHYALSEKELQTLYGWVAVRLVLSVVHSNDTKGTAEDNDYKQISAIPAWELLKKWRDIHPNFAYYSFRAAVGNKAHPLYSDFEREIRLVSPICPIDSKGRKVAEIDLGTSGKWLGIPDRFNAPKKMQNVVDRFLERTETEIAIGGYMEVRPIYTQERFIRYSNEGKDYRALHLGQDIWTLAGTEVVAPLDGEVYSVYDNAGDGNYGPTIILRHQLQSISFFTLFGHLSRESLQMVTRGQQVKQGQRIATVGPPPENGNWAPHLHFQLMLDMLDNQTDFIGVCSHYLHAVYEGICPDPGWITGWMKPSDRSSYQDIYKKRKSVFAPNLSLSYQKPLLIERAYKQYLIDQTGRKYLDTVNNVPHVGHQHPAVVEAAIRQVELLNTNTRYLNRSMNEYAEQLLSYFPPPFDTVFLVNSGSEANELAMRIAKTATGREAMIAMEMGYHGNTEACIRVSSYKFDRKGGKGKPPLTELIGLPHLHYGNPPVNYHPSGASAIKALEERREKPAGFIGESILSCAGQWVMDSSLLQEIYRSVRNAGGVCIADEVQVGFGRVGEKFWGFELMDVVPDIVTLGKPIGNGHPLGAVVTSKALAEAFNNGMEYFNTFGGNAVSCEIGKAVLSVIESENLQVNALEVGNHLFEGWRYLQQRHPIINELRGKGLFSGFELTENGKPATEKASYLINRMRSKGILMSTDGPYNNIIKVKPPIIFNRADADFLLEEMEEVLKETFVNS